MSAGPPGGFLDEMVAAARERVAEARRRDPLDAPVAVAPGRLRTTLRDAAGAGRLGVIAEVKRRSPSKGDIAPGLDAAAQARAYEAAGADAVSVLTEPVRFGGALDDLAEVTAAVRLPVLRKDFVVDAYQVREAAAAGAAAVLLIVAALDDQTLADLVGECDACGLDALVEVHDAEELRRALRVDATIVGVNNRDLHSLEVDLGVTERLAGLLPRRVRAGDATAESVRQAGMQDDDVVLVSESGIATFADARRVARAGAQAALVGEALVRCAPERLPDLVACLQAAGRPS